MSRETAAWVLFLVLPVLIHGAASGPARGQCEAPELAKFEPSNAGHQYFFGHSAAVDGDVAVIGAYRDWTAGHEAGMVFVFRREAGVWVEEAQLLPSDIADDDEFGASVGISGDTVVVGANFDDDGGTDSGSAYVFEYDGSSWGEVAKLTASDALGWDNFGFSVSIDGDVVVVGANLDDHAGANSGSAYIFEKPSGGWADMTETAKIVSADLGENHEFGKSVSVSGDTAVVGAHFVTLGEVEKCGAVYVFGKGSDGWAQAAKLTASDGETRDYLGRAVAIDGDVVVAGAWGDDDGASQAGAAYVYEKPAGGWTDMTETAKLTASDAAEGDHLGWTVSVDGGTVAAGAPANNWDGNGYGAAYAYVRPASGWSSDSETVRYTASDGAEDDSYAVSVAVGGAWLIAGASFHKTDLLYGAGAAYVHGGLADCQPNGVPDACDISAGTSADNDHDGVPDECQGSGDRAGSVEASLAAAKAGEGEITLSWDASCIGTDSDYAVYEGSLGDFTSHAARFCTTGGELSKTFLPAEESAYYLVVPGNTLYEGTYGTDGGGAERPVAADACLPRLVTDCP